MTRKLRASLIGMATGLMLAIAAPSFAADKAPLTIWTGDEAGASAFRKVAEEYTKRTGTRVVVSVPDKRVVDAFQEAAAAGQKGPDIFVWPHDHIGEWSRKGWLAPVDASARVKADVLQIAWDAVTSNGRQWAYPVGVEVMTLVYNKDLISEPPKSFEEIPALAQKLKAKGVTAMAWELRSAYYSWPLLAAGGANVFQRDPMGNYLPKQTGVNQPSVIKGAEFITGLIKNGTLSASMTTKEAEDAMKGGKLAVLITGPWLWADLAKAGIKYGVAPLPTFAGRPARPFVGVVAAMISASSPNKKAAADFLETAVVTPQGLQEINKLRPLGIPASKELFWNFYGDQQVQKSMESVFVGYVMPNNPEMQFFWKYFDKSLGDIVSGTAKPKDALDAAAKAIVAGQ